MSSDLLVVRNLKKYFPLKNSGFFARHKSHLYAVDGVSFRLKEGETLGLVGESGCGKSTLGRTILRLYEPSGGDVLFDGVNVAKLSSRQMRAQRRNMQIIFQDPYSSLNPRMKIGSILREPFIIHGIGNKHEQLAKVDRLLDIVGLDPDAKTKYPHEFSGGQRQRIGIARAIALEPKLVIADEPVSALDVSIQSQILNLLVDLRRKFKLSYLFIAHDLAVVEHISDWVAVMYLGRIVEYARAESLYRRPSHPYTKALIDAIPVANFDSKKKSQKQILTGDVPSPANPPAGCHFHPRCPIATDVCRKDTPMGKGLQDEPEHQVACHHVH